ncbi:ACP S-malonyltransferase [Pelagibacteraceae bacterium GOM-A1]|nr:ACP S-malonyltransferase [Pelagibacteraceae bacterium GOM-A1]
MFSIIFPGQGSQIIGMAKEFYDNFGYVKDYFKQADEILNKKVSKIILEGPKESLDLTENTQPSIFLASFSIFKVLEMESKLNVKDAKYYAGHSLGEYSALCCAEAIDFSKTIELLKFRGIAMQNAVPKGEGGMIAVLGQEINDLNKLIKDNYNNFQCYIANDNSNGQIVVSGKLSSIKKFGEVLKKKKIKFVELPVSAPFHCPLMSKATEEMKSKILNTKFNNPSSSIISNVTAKPENNPEQIKELLIEQIEKPVRWRESVENMIGLGVNKFIEVGPGKVLSGLIKRIDRNVILNQVNNLEDVKNILND